MGLLAHFPNVTPAPAPGPNRSIGNLGEPPAAWAGEAQMIANMTGGRGCAGACERAVRAGAAGRARAGIQPPTRLLPRAARGQASRDPVPFLQSSVTLKCRRTSRPSTTSTRRPPTVGRTSISYTVPLPDFVPTVTSPR